MSTLQFARLLDQDENIIGIWVKDRADAENRVGVSVWLKQLGAPQSLCGDASAGNVKILPNNQDSRGGYFVFVGPARFCV
jgi:hypothetical protein